MPVLGTQIPYQLALLNFTDDTREETYDPAHSEPRFSYMVGYAKMTNPEIPYRVSVRLASYKSACVLSHILDEDLKGM
jgi:hypothetical protein